MQTCCRLTARSYRAKKETETPDTVTIAGKSVSMVTLHRKSKECAKFTEDVSAHFLSGVPLAPRKYIIGSGLDKAGDTSQLVFGLTWGDTEYSGLVRRRLTRRMGFPSWSWVGWKVEVVEAGKTKPGPVIELFGLESTYSPFSSRRPGSFEHGDCLGRQRSTYPKQIRQRGNPNISTCQRLDI